MAPPRNVRVEKDAVETRLADERNTRLLLEFARQRLRAGLAGFDAAARKVPARNIPVPHQEDGAVLLDHDAAHPQRHRPRQEKAQLPDTRRHPLTTSTPHATPRLP